MVFIAILVVFAGIMYAVYSEQSTDCGCCQGSCCMITADTSTWPNGDKIWDICRAIALAEGANISGSAPDRANNPGDISDELTTYGSLTVGSLITKFPDKQTGWQALYTKISNIVNGNSMVYFATDSWSTIAIKYAGDSSDWLANVTSNLGVTADSTIADYVNG